MYYTHAFGEQLVYAGVVFTIIIVISFFGIIASQTYFLDSKLLRLQVLSTRLSMFLPTYAILMMFSLAYPSIYQALTFPIAVAEGASFYSFFALMITNLGGPDGYIQAVTKLNSAPVCCYSLCDGNNHTGRFNRVKRAIQAMLSVRLVLVLIALICNYIGAKAGYYVCTLLSAAIVAYSILSLAIMFEMVHPVSNNFKGVLKLLLMKLSVGLIVYEGVIATFIARSEAAKHGPAGIEIVNGLYCCVVLAEFALFCPVYLYAFGSKIQPPPHPVHSIDTGHEIDVVDLEESGIRDDSGRGIFRGRGRLRNVASIRIRNINSVRTLQVVAAVVPPPRTVRPFEEDEEVQGGAVTPIAPPMLHRAPLQEGVAERSLDTSNQSASRISFLFKCFNFYDYWTDPVNYLVLTEQAR